MGAAVSRLRQLILIAILAIAGPTLALAEVEVRDFTSEAERIRYQVLIDELRCPQCQNQNLAASDAPIARDLRDEVLKLLREGRSDGEIVDHLVARYGDFVRYRPAWQPATYLLWLGPGLLLAVAGAMVALVIRRRRAATALTPTPEQRAAVTRLLESDGDRHHD